MAIRLNLLAEDIRIASVENDHDAAAEKSATGGSQLDLLPLVSGESSVVHEGVGFGGSSSVMRNGVIHCCRRGGATAFC